MRAPTRKTKKFFMWLVFGWLIIIKILKTLKYDLNNQKDPKNRNIKIEEPIGGKKFI